MGSWLALLVPWLAGGGSAGAAFFALKWFVEWLSGRYDKQIERIDRRGALVDAGMQRLVDLLTIQTGSLTDRLMQAEARIEEQSLELDECRTQHAACEKRMKQLEGTLQGMGDARQEAARIVAEADRLRGRN